MYIYENMTEREESSTSIQSQGKMAKLLALVKMTAIGQVGLMCEITTCSTIKYLVIVSSVVLI